MTDVKKQYEVTFRVSIKTADHLGDAILAVRDAIENLTIEGDGWRDDASTAVEIVDAVPFNEGSSASLIKVSRDTQRWARAEAMRRETPGWPGRV